MIRIKVSYDAYNRTFKLLDRDFGSVLEDGGTYELNVPFIVQDLSKVDDLTPLAKPHLCSS
jgi:hypothetical protein